MPKMILMIGVPAAGKSTIRNNFLSMAKEEYVVLSTDDILEQIAKEQGKTYSDVFDQNIKQANSNFFAEFDRAVRTGKNILIDRTNLTPQARKKFIDAGKKNGYHVVALNVPTPPEQELMRRLEYRAKHEGKFIPPGVVRSMMDSLIPASKSEGFDEIF